MKNLRKALVGVVALFTLYACSSGGSGGVPVPPPPATALTGTVTDTALEPVPGATVTILGTASTTTDAAGRYSFTALPASTEYTLKFSGPGPSYFPTFAKATLTENNPTVLDVYLARAGNNPVPTVNDTTLGGTVVSDFHIDGPQFATLTLVGNELEDASGLYAGIADVYITPIDVGKLGYGLASYQTTLGNVFAALTASSSIVELYGAAAVRINDDAGNALSLIAPSTSTLEIPIPASPAGLRANAVNPATLWYLDETTGNWVEDGTATVDIPLSPTAYTGTISRTGIWRVGLAHDTITNTVTEISGQVTYNNGTPAAGVTVYVNGVDYAYQNQTTTDANGNFSSLVKKDAGTGVAATVTIHCVVSANGAQWPYEQEFTGTTLADISLPFAPPVAGAVATQTIIVDNRDTTFGTGPDVLGYVLASGRRLFDPDPAADTTARNIGNVVFVANDLAGVSPVTVGVSLNNSGILVISGQTFETLSTVPTTGYLNNSNAAAFTVNLDPSAVTTFPVLLAIQTDKGHYAKISIDAVTDVTPGLNVEDVWQITFRHAFSLTNTF